MRRKEIDERTKVNGHYVSDLVRGFFGEQNEGNRVLGAMGLPANTVPFSAALLLQNRKTQWKDSEGNVARISYRIDQSQLECTGSYKKGGKSIKVVLEWSEHDDPEMVRRLESEAIGDLCMKCIYDNLIK